MEPNPKYHQIAASIRKAVLEGRLIEGQVLLEGPIASIFRISRSPVRKALELLESERILQRFDGRGLMVGDAASKPVRVDLTPPMFGLERPLFLQRRPWDALYFRVERDLVLGSAIQSRKINESQLARHYRMSRTLTSQVLARAERSGVVRRDDIGGWSTNLLDGDRVKKLFDLRALLEPKALADVARSGEHKGFVGEMEERLSRCLASTAALNAAQKRQLEYDLHVACLDLNTNEVLARALFDTRCALLVNVYDWSLTGPGSLLETLREHHTIIAAIGSGDEDGVIAESSRHLESTLTLTMKNLARLERAAEEFEAPFFKKPKSS